MRFINLQFTNLKKTSIGRNVYIDDDVVVVYVPSTQRSVWDGVYKTPLLMSNCKGIIIPNKIQKIYNKQLNGRIHYLEAKKHFVEMKNVTKRIPVYGTLNLKSEEKSTKKKKQFYFFDTSIIIQGITQLLEKLPEKRIYEILLSEFNKIHTSIKSQHPEKSVVFIFDIISKNDFFYFFFSNFRRLKVLLKDSLSTPFFDYFLFASIHERLIPLVEIDKDGNIQPIFSMLHRLDQFIETSEYAEEIDGTPAIQDKDVPSDVEKPLPNKSIFSQIVDNLKGNSVFTSPEVKKFTNDDLKNQIKIKTKVDDELDKIKIDIDNKTLTKIMKHFKITNSDILANVKAAIDDYIKETGVVPTKANAELLILKAVSKSIHGTDQIDDIYLAKPNLLFEKLQEVNVFSVPVNFPKDDQIFPFKVSDIVTLKNVTGQHRQKFEFTETIHDNIKKVFKTLENQKHPIKVLKISYNYIDTNMDRYTEYVIDLQNMDGNKQKYSVKLFVPTVINDKYFKIGGNR